MELLWQPSERALHRPEAQPCVILWQHITKEEGRDRILHMLTYGIDLICSSKKLPASHPRQPGMQHIRICAAITPHRTQCINILF
jgi:hypothetical protein